MGFCESVFYHRVKEKKHREAQSILFKKSLCASLCFQLGELCGKNTFARGLIKGTYHDGFVEQLQQTLPIGRYFA